MALKAVCRFCGHRPFGHFAATFLLEVAESCAHRISAAGGEIVLLKTAKRRGFDSRTSLVKEPTT